VNARRAAREIALMALSQLNFKAYKDENIEDIILSTVRTIANSAEEELKTSVGALLEIREYIEKYEMEHPTNIERPLGVSDLPVPIPLTSDMIGRIDSLIDVAEKSFRALEVAEFTALANQQEVKEYAIKVINTYCNHKSEVDEEITKSLKGWNLSRLIKIDKSILSIATTELLYFEDIPVKVSIDEAVELAKKYSEEESSSFINGILGQIVDNNDIHKITKK